MSPITLRNYRMHIRTRIRPAFGAERLDRMTPALIQQWVSAGMPDLAPGSIKTTVDTLSAALRRAVELRELDANPCRDVRLPRQERREKPALDPAGAAGLLDAVRGSPMFAPILFGLAIGARLGEVAALTWSAIGDDGSTVTIDSAIREISASDKRRGGTKTSRMRRVRLPAYAVSELRLWRLEQAEQFLALGARPGPSTAICTDPAGRPLSPSQISDGFRRVRRRLGLAINFHGLRHTSASTALAAGASIREVSGMLGHARASVTLDTYSHIVEGVASDAADRLDEVMRKARGGMVATVVAKSSEP